MSFFLIASYFGAKFGTIGSALATLKNMISFVFAEQGSQKFSYKCDVVLRSLKSGSMGAFLIFFSSIFGAKAPIVRNETLPICREFSIFGKLESNPPRIP